MPLVYQKTTGHNGTVGVWRIDENAGELRQMVSLTNEDDRQLASFVRDQRKCEWLAVRILIQQLTGTPPQIGYHPSGAPFLANSPMKISITHTKGFAAVALHPTHVIGIDIEYPSVRILKIADRFMNDPEMSHAPADDTVTYQTVCWCAKEALYKWWGKTDVSFRDELLLEPFAITRPEFSIGAVVVRNGEPQAVTLTGIVNDHYILTFVNVSRTVR
ncbi:MAG: 4'-phosphopantetheinyl transferase superfamily protein [Breznakibacter sp.]